MNLTTVALLVAFYLVLGFLIFRFIKRLHREAFPTIFYATTIFALLNLGIWRLFHKTPPVYIGVFILSTILLYATLSFFRYSSKKIKAPESIISPAFGKIVVLEKMYEKEHFKIDMLQVSIFMSPLNIHANWIPIDGKVTYFNYNPGRHFPAFVPKSSEFNEHTSVAIKGEQCAILVKQIAGYLARRIVSYVNLDDDVEQSEELGFIKFGSRVDLFLPLDVNLNVQLGDVVKGGQTIIAQF